MFSLFFQGSATPGGSSFVTNELIASSIPLSLCSARRTPTHYYAIVRERFVAIWLFLLGCRGLGLRLRGPRDFLVAVLLGLPAPRDRELELDLPVLLQHEAGAERLAVPGAEA